MTNPVSTPAYHADELLDITRDRCPMTFVRVRLALDRMRRGEILLVTLAGDEPRRNVPVTAEQQGHEVLTAEDGDGDVTRLWLRKG